MKKEKDIAVSVVIPTYRRIENLIRLLKSIASQTSVPKEIIIVAAGYHKKQLEQELSSFNLPISLVFSEPSVCHQRNIGISLATSEYIQLCDDDIVIPENYIEKLSAYLYDNEKVNIVTGIETVQDSELNWHPFSQQISFFGLLYKYIFGLSVWSDLSQKTTKNFVYKKLISYYLKRGNTISKAGWPVLINLSENETTADVYGLGCAMFRGNVLKKNPYNENLGQHGIGDNYDLAFRINKQTGRIHILKTSAYKHFKVQSNRLPAAKQYYNRTKALLDCIRRLPVFDFSSKICFLWSLIGNGLYFLVRLKFIHFYKNLRIMGYTLIALLSTKRRLY